MLAYTLTVDEVLVATGRRANTKGIGLETVGLDPNRPIAVDDQLRARGVDDGWLYAIGDVNGRVPQSANSRVSDGRKTLFSRALSGKAAMRTMTAA